MLRKLKVALFFVVAYMIVLLSLFFITAVALAAIALVLPVAVYPYVSAYAKGIR